MRIAQIATCTGPVRQDETGSVEAMVWLLTRELTARGHEVTVFGCAGSEAQGGVVPTLPGPYGSDGVPHDWQACEWVNLCRATEMSGRFDVMHSHAYLWGLPLDALSAAPMVHTMHTCPYEDEARLWDLFPQAAVTAISAHQWRGVGTREPLAVVHHGVDPGAFTFNGRPGAYLCYLGRFIPGKGPLDAIAVAERLEMPLVMAGPRNDFFEREVQPRVDGERVRYVGSVDRARRDALLGGALALVYPLRDPEPFGLVQVEAMMCGTPVAATRIGAVPELVDEGRTGFTAGSPEALGGAVLAAARLDRRLVRERALERFSAARMALEYERVYERVFAARAPATGR